MRGADASSDHLLVVSKIKIKLRRSKKGEQRSARLDVGKLKDPSVKKSFQVELRNRFNVLDNRQDLDLEVSNKEILAAGEKILGRARKRKEQWISSETWKTIDERRQTKQKILQSRSERLKQQ